MKIFLICPIRGVDQKSTKKTVEALETMGNTVYYPARDTDQKDSTKGFQICCANLIAIKECDVVGIMWDGKSQGCLFDLGMAFALNKKIKLISLPDLTKDDEKSFQDMCCEWASQQAYREFIDTRTSEE